MLFVALGIGVLKYLIWNLENIQNSEIDSTYISTFQTFIEYIIFSAFQPWIAFYLPILLWFRYEYSMQEGFTSIIPINLKSKDSAIITVAMHCAVIAKHHLIMSLRSFINYNIPHVACEMLFRENYLNLDLHLGNADVIMDS